ncbi:1-(5-phosphoribosyl)-5-[(5-phosphoribosylamino)methylideneamino]imidazole-4-carboxamide isomerase [Eisenibacter elegans]|jgi:phosphoribosylformimino-5-aminoimidazole carboxamide ribotide isomerase|uniref:1-(5-phosphoribosyl)-5-[(5- phosphoribosylamino)methylideneamino]imidazole-4- carboxamide isomerase n=1 Tax=Eisenibacter elegans TaxID=997 RepID=UPI00041BA016|nr:1-(5-phosphoribosyl)-5-[(5-phosphoribosylamino)methylideneamino]imidazole-4-carboxamide isomerase [Eisenibacter elegans]
MIQAIPAIDLIDGACVRLSQGDYAQKTVYESDPVAMAKRFEAAGFSRLHIVDLDGAKAGVPQHLEVLRAIADQTSLVLDYGGGIKTSDNVRQILKSGAAMVSVGSIAHKNPELVKSWISDFGSKSILLAADVRDEMIALNAWQEASQTSIFDYIADYAQAGLTQFFCTDVSKDGLLQGVAEDLYRRLREAFPALHLVASGGVSQLSDVTKLNTLGVDAVIIGKAIYEGRITLEELKVYA